MKKTLLIMVMALAVLLTQCRKPEVKFPTPSSAEGVTVSMTVTAGPGSKTDITAEGAITWSSGDKLYVGYNGAYVGYLTLTSGQNTPTGWFSGNVTLPTDTENGEKTFHFFYLGSDNSVAAAVGATSVDVSFAEQNIYNNGGKLENAKKFHVGYGSAKGTVTDGVVTGINVTLVSKVALARFSFKKGDAAYDGALTLSGDHIYSSMTVGFNGSFDHGATPGNITLTAGHGERYVMLVPTGATTAQTLTFTGSAEDGTGDVPGLESNKFYGKTGAIAVTLTAPTPASVFTVDKAKGTTVEFALGNLYYNGADDSHKMNGALPSGWNFYGHQWDCYPSGTSPVTESMEINLFTWGYGDWSTDYSTMIFQTGEGVTMTDWGTAPGLPSAGEGKKWRTLTDDEWKNLLGIGGGTSPRDNASSLHAWKELDGGAHKGLVILPDGTEDPSTVMGSITSTEALATSGAVFLPAADCRSGTFVLAITPSGQYWSSTPKGSNNACYLSFGSGSVLVSDIPRLGGRSVRLVR